jgi:thiamine pyrophosphate-dependent acetolactate synthase large subunit-like protein
MSEKMKFAEVLLKEIKRRGVKRIFGVPGRENASILFNEVEGLDYITARVEFNAGVMADATGRLTRKPQVCFSTMGPGATNMTTAIASAMLNHSPLVFISAQLESDDRFYNLTHQCVDQVAIMAPITKWSYELKTADELPWAIDHAFNTAMTEPIGPVHISVPTNFFATKIDVTHDLMREAPQKITLTNGAIDVPSVAAAHRCLAKAKMPVCLIGGGVVRVGAQEASLAFCREWNIPFITAANAKGIAPFDDPLNYGAASPYMEGILGYAALQEIYNPVDVLLCIGYQYVDDLLPKMWEYGCPKTIISIGNNPIREIHSKFKPDIECKGDIGRIVRQISDCGIQAKSSRNLNGLKDVYLNISLNQPASNGSLTPIQVINVINDHIKDGILCTDIGYYRHHAILFANPCAVGRFCTDAGLSSFGSGLPSAMAAQFEYPDKRVFLICGDGGFHSGSGDLETLARYGLPVVVIVMNNDSFKLIELYQRRGNGTHNPKVVSLGKVDFVRLAEANGCHGVLADSVESLSNAIGKHDWSRPLVIEVPVQYRDRDSFRESF